MTLTLIGVKHTYDELNDPYPLKLQKLLAFIIKM